MEVIVDCGKCTDKSSAHAYLKAQFGFPDYYGANLDALYDCLMEVSDCEILLQNPAALYGLGDYGVSLLEVLKDAARDNPSLELSAGNCN